ncbi:MAG: hypothetical protein ABI813_03590 [Bacteroidota bacterium]
MMEITTPKENSSLIRQALDHLEENPVLLNGKLIKPSQCYRFSTDPPRILYNTNCPEDLMGKIEAILLQYRYGNEDRT